MASLLPGEIDIGQPVVPNEAQYQGINSKDTTKTVLVYGRRIPLQSLWTAELASQVTMGVNQEIPELVIKHYLRLWQFCSQAIHHSECMMTVSSWHVEYKEKIGLDKYYLDNVLWKHQQLISWANQARVMLTWHCTKSADRKNCHNICIFNILTDKITQLL